MTWHNTIPEDKIWIKVGGDHGRDSFKLCLQILNVENPNAKNNLFMICLVECKDTYENLSIVLSPFRAHISKLKQMTWTDKRGSSKSIEVSVFGDYAFECTLFGLSGPTGTHSCLWCLDTREMIQKAPSSRPLAPRRTLRGLFRDNERYVKAGEDKKKARAYNNVVNRPIWNVVQLTSVVPPYLHQTLGIVKRHHDLLERECHALDQEIALELKASAEGKVTNKFKNFVKDSKEIRAKMKQKHSVEVQESGRIIYQETVSGDLQDIYDAVHHLDQLIDSMEGEQKKLPTLLGPVTANLATVLARHKIVAKAHHSRCFIGNHCNKYLQPPVYTDLCDNVVIKTAEMTDNKDLHDKAIGIKRKFYTLNQLYSTVHHLISHRRPILPASVEEIQEAIENYMSFYRTSFPGVSIIPKQHVLEAHCAEFIEMTGFGLAFLGEQGGEQIHATLERLRFWGIREDGDRLQLWMRAHNLQCSPDLLSTLDNTKKKVLSVL